MSSETSGDGRFAIIPGQNINSTSDAFVIETGGDVGVGVSDPQSKLDVDGSLLVRPSGTSVGDGGLIVIRELAASGTNSVSLAAPDTLASDLKWTLPAMLGTANQVLRNSSTPGILEWAADQGADHGTAAGLSDGDHAQYALLAGRSGGQSLIGGTDASVDLTIDSSSNATKGNIILNPSGGSVGLGNASPASTFDVNGDIRVGETTNSCTVSNKGAMRYNDVASVIEFCNGSDWFIMQAAACSDPTPDVLSFSDQVNQSTTTLVTSDAIQVTSINCSVPVTISGPGAPEYRICSDSGCGTIVQGWTSSPSSLVAGQYLQARVTTDAVGGSTFASTFKVGGAATVWNVSTTGDCVSAPVPGTVCADGTIYAGLSSDGSVPMYTTRCDFGQAWNGVSCTGARSALTWKAGAGSVATGFIDLSTGQSNSAGIAALTGAASPHIAAQNCEALSLNSHTDWYLPAQDELMTLYSSRGPIGNFTNNYYWSSSEANDNFAKAGAFQFGTASNFSKNNGYHVRCVRR